ncbi:helicase-related protein [Streptomyces cacaoi]
MTETALEQRYTFREALEKRLREDLVGPLDIMSREVIDDPPITRYITGVLFPQGDAPLEESSLLDIDHEGRRADLEADPDPAVAMSNLRYPSSMGTTFAVDTNVSPTVQVETDAARYVPLENQAEDDAPSDSRDRGRRGRRSPWQREPLSLPVKPIDATKPGERREQLSEGLELSVRVRPRDAEAVASVTVTLINARTAQGHTRDADSFFQPQMTITAAENTAPFVARSAPSVADDDAELASARLLYRFQPAFATGHGCAVTWKASVGEDPNAPVRASVLRTTFAPEYDLWLSDSNDNIDTDRLGMHRLATVGSEEIRDSLHELVRGYRAWIADRRTDAGRFTDPALRATADEHLSLCEEACDRMAAGVEYLQDRKVMDAFRLANRAMAQQRARTDWLRIPTHERPPEPDIELGVWRPFQIAFVLLSLGGIVDDETPDRDIADVLWFPTGGGKTEAYLGLIAFTVFLRRLRSDDGNEGAGVTVLMRYTLRLLTTQQFERAALLICCMEQLRLESPEDCGGKEISIGMWVGEGATPNKLRDARTALRKLGRGEDVPEKNPVQLRSCPWCGTTLDHKNYRAGREELNIACGESDCKFGDRLPVHVVDETLYKARPTLVIATADKFAGLPWRDQIASLFNIGYDDPPPDLIVQDELHLISGPLGTLTGLYEGAIDLAAGRPKVVASTATIRRAEQQGRALFDRRVRQFPPPGLDARDSYFAVETRPEDKASRKYLGFMAPSVSQTSLLVRAYAALLHHAQAIEAPDCVRDPYWTLLGYFNSLRVLAGARLQVQDDVADHLKVLATQHKEPERKNLVDIELTSREASSEIRKYLDDMAKSLPDDAIDVILATNMISVGVDIDRLGLMVVMGQPQSTSEYIQATSRVGRKWPGLVVTLFNAARSRDRSHYESFTAYHSALYRQVEATSVTPFSARARDRALHAVVVGLARLLIPEARANDGAARIEDFADKLSDLCARLLDRAESVSGGAELSATRHQVEEIVEAWQDRAMAEPDLVYTDPRNPRRALLINAGSHDESDDEIADTWPTLWSLRDVDVESKLYVGRGIS